MATLFTEVDVVFCLPNSDAAPVEYHHHKIGLMPRATFYDLFSIDIRSLAFFRIGLALILLWDLADRAKSLTAHYTDLGVLPRLAITQHFVDTFLSFHMLGGSRVFIGTLFILAAIFAVMLLMGWYTRCAAVLSFLFLFSLQQRNILILDGGDRLLRFLLMWSIFLPLGATASVDAWRHPHTARPIRVFSVAGIALLMQPIALYVVVTVSKLQSAPWIEGRALYSALNTAIIVRPLGEALLAAPRVVETLNYATIAIEGIIPIMLVLPWWADRMRVGAVMINFVLQGGIWLCMNLGEFQPLTALALVPFIPTSVWDRAARFRLPATPEPSVHAAVVIRNLFWERPLQRVTSAFVGLAFMYVLASNIATLIPPHYGLPEPWTSYGRILQLNQRWRMFSNADATPQGWFVMIGHLQDGAPIDIRQPGTTVSLTRPESYAATFQNSTWRNYWTKIIQTKFEGLRPYLVDYFCSQWNRQTASQPLLSEIDIIHMYEFANDPHKAKRVVPVRLIRKSCPASPTILSRHQPD